MWKCWRGGEVWQKRRACLQPRRIVDPPIHQQASALERRKTTKNHTLSHTQRWRASRDKTRPLTSKGQPASSRQGLAAATTPPPPPMVSLPQVEHQYLARKVTRPCQVLDMHKWAEVEVQVEDLESSPHTATAAMSPAACTARCALGVS